MKHLVQGRSELCKPCRSISHNQFDRLPGNLALTRIGRQDGFDEVPSFERHFAIRRPDILDDLDVPTQRKRILSAVAQAMISRPGRLTHKSHRPTCLEMASSLSTSYTYDADPEDLSAVQPRSLVLLMRALTASPPNSKYRLRTSVRPFAPRSRARYSWASHTWS
jgi:hypothetical protein